MSGIRTTLCLALAAVTLTMASADAQAPKKQLVVGAQPGPRHPRPDAVPHLRGAHHLLPDVREALRDRREPEHPAAARRRPAGRERRRQDRHHQAAVRREVQRRHALHRGGHEALARPAPRDEGLQPPQRAGVGHRGRGRRSAHDAAAAQGAVLAAHGAARRPAGMPVSPAADKKLGDKFGTAPVCVGPWQFVERVPQDRIVVERSPHYFDQAAAKFDRIVFRIIPDDNVRLANLRSGDIDVMHHGGAHRRRQPQEGGALRGLQRHRPRLQLGHDQPAQQDRQDEPARRPRHAAGQRSRACARRSSCRSTARRSTRSPTTARTRSAAGPSRPTASSSTRRASARPATWPAPRSCWPTPGWPSGYKFEMVIVNNPQQRRVGEVIQGMAREAGFDHQPAARRSSPPRSRTTTTASTRRS